MKEAARIFYKKVEKDKKMHHIIDQHIRNQSAIISRNYCTEPMHMPPYMDAILPETIDFRTHNLIILTIGNGRIKQQIHNLKNYIHSQNKPRYITLAKWSSFKKYLIGYIVYNYYDVKTKAEASKLSNLSETYLRTGIIRIAEILNSPDIDQKILKELAQKAINYQTGKNNIK